MMSLLRFLFGLGGETGSRRVAGAAESPAQKELPYVLDSNKRLLRLQELCARYKPTPYAQQLYAVLEKTKHIHAYLVSRNRAQELEIFHLQHTDHFINTFTAIIEMHQRHEVPVAPEAVVKDTTPKASAPPPRKPHRPTVPPVPNYRSQFPFEDKLEDVLRKIESGTIRGFHTAHKVSEMVKRVAEQTGLSPFSETAAGPVLSMPNIAIDTYTKIPYRREKVMDEYYVYKIGYTSPPEEKEAFLSYVSEQLGISGFKYMGNTTVHFSNGDAYYNSPAVLPVINWHGACYALGLGNKCLYPVKAFRN